MAFGPKTIEEKEFKHVALRGYSIDEVDEFLDEVADEVEKLQRSNRALEEKLVKMSEKEKSFSELEVTLRDTLVTAQKAADEVVRAARTQAEAILADAEKERKRIIGEAEIRAQTASSQLTNIQGDVLRVKEAIRRALQDQLRLLDVSYPETPAAPKPTFSPEAPQKVTLGSPMGSTREFSLRDTLDSIEERVSRDSDESQK